MFLKQSTAYTFRHGPFLDETDGKTAETGLTISQADVRLSKAGGNFAQKNESSSSSHDEIGFYIVVLDATDTNTCGELLVAVHESGALPVFKTFQVLEEAIYTALFAASATGELPADVVKVSGDATAADNLELMYDGTGYAGGTAKLTVNATLIEGSDATDQINAACDAAIVTYGLDHLVSASVAGGDITDNSIVAKLVSKESTADWDDYVNTTDSLQAIRDRGDGSWTTGAGGSPPQLMQNTTIASLASQTSFTLTAGSADDAAYNAAVIVITDQSTGVQKLMVRSLITLEAVRLLLLAQTQVSLPWQLGIP